MSLPAIRNFHQALASLDLELGTPAPRARNDAQMGIKELEVLRLDADIVTPPEVADAAEPLVETFRGQITTGDHLRLPQLTALDGPAMRAAIGRILARDTRAAGGTDAELAAEGRMRRVLSALEDTVAQIQRRAAIQHRG